MLKDYYKILEIPRSAPSDEIRKTYLRLAKQLHPDLNPADNQLEEKFKEVQEAYQILSDPSKKRQYDYQWNLEHIPNIPPVNLNKNQVNWADVFRRQQEAQKRQDENRRERRRLNWIASFIALAFVIVFPIIFLLLAQIIGRYAAAWLVFFLIPVSLLVLREVERYQRYRKIPANHGIKAQILAMRQRHSGSIGDRQHNPEHNPADQRQSQPSRHYALGSGSVE
ncbi:MAG: J domain-containing protein [Bacteroidia bacterium]|nr:J domain-containing protein [Bacteroidia bacterium]